MKLAIFPADADAAWQSRVAAEQDEDDKHKEYCEAEFDKAGDEETAAKDKMASEAATILKPFVRCLEPAGAAPL